MADKQGCTIVIKRVKKGGHGHHGGAWKVAYADFVTAMMAFFFADVAAANGVAGTKRSDFLLLYDGFQWQRRRRFDCHGRIGKP